MSGEEGICFLFYRKSQNQKRRGGIELEYSVSAIGAVVMQGAINSLGSVAVAAQTAGEKIRQMFTLPMESVGMAMATYVGQNYGAKKIDRIYQGIRSGLTIQYSYCAVIWVVIFVMKTPLVGLVLSETTSATATGAVEYLTVMSALFFIHGSLMIMRNTLQGLGYSMQAIISGRIKKPLYVWNERPVNSGFLYCQNF